MDNDANAGALGELRYGAGRGCLPLFYMTLSTGVGGGIVTDSGIYRGADSWAGEIGHMTIRPDGPDCLCGAYGCLERMCSGLWMERDYGKSGKELLRDPARIDEAVEHYIADDFREFSPRAPGWDKAAAAAHLKQCAARGETFEEARHMADGSLVLIHGRAFTGEHPLGYSQMHLYRVTDGKIAAHWSIRQEIPEYSVAGRCMVQGPLEEGRHKGGPRPAAGH